MKSKFYSLTIIFIYLFGVSLCAQISIKSQYGFIQDFYSLSDNNSNIFISGWAKFKNGKGFDGEAYNNIELQYKKNRNIFGARIRLNRHTYEYCYNAAVGETNFLSCLNTTIETPINISLHYYRSLLTYKSRWSLITGIGLGTKQFYNVGYLNNENNLLSSGTGQLIQRNEGNIRVNSLEYLNESNYYLPMEIVVDLKLTTYLSLSLNLGYNCQFNKYSTRTDLEYYYEKSPQEIKQITIFTNNEGYVGLGLALILDFKKTE